MARSIPPDGRAPDERGISVRAVSVLSVSGLVFLLLLGIVI